MERPALKNDCHNDYVDIDMSMRILGYAYEVQFLVLSGF
jgi:hypothetical protein